MQCLQFDFDIYTGRQVQAHQGIHSLWSRVHDVDQAFMCTHFELFPRILILVHRTENGNYLFLSWRGSDRIHQHPNVLLSQQFSQRIDQELCGRMLSSEYEFLLCHFIPSFYRPIWYRTYSAKIFQPPASWQGAGCVGNLSHHRNVAEQHSLLYIKDRRIASTNS